MPRFCSRLVLLGAAALGACFLLASPAGAQGLFGKNKITYESRQWYVLTTEHCEVYFYPDEERLAREVAACAESTAAEYDTLFKMRPRQRIPILTYASHQAFQQSHAASGFIGEGTGGLTELLRGRVLIPHNGSTARLLWVTRHELVHAYMLEKLSQAAKVKNKKNRVTYPPLWFTEGLAEFVATTWDSDAEGMLQDAVLTNVAVPLTESWSIEGTVLMYKEGQSFLEYVAENHGGKRAVLDLFEHWTDQPTFEDLWKEHFGEKLVDTDRAWFESIRRHFYPAVATRRPVKDYAHPLTCCDDTYNLAPAVLGQAPGDSTVRIAYLQADEGVVDLRLRTLLHGRTVRDERLLRSGLSAKFESFHFFRTRLGASKDGKIAVVSQRGGADVLHIYDLAERDVVATWSFPGIVGLASPAWLPGDSTLVVVGQANSGQTDLYRIRLADGAMTPLTHDAADDDDPAPHPTRNTITFTSDREGGPRGHKHLFEYDLASGSITQVTSGEFNEWQSQWSPDGSRLVFLSDRQGIADLFLWEDGRVQRASRFLGPTHDPAWLPDGRTVVFAGQSKWQFHLYMLPVAPTDSLWLAESGTRLRLGPPEATKSDEPAEMYRRKLGLDFAQSIVAMDPAMGAGGGGGGMIAFSDVLGAQGYSIMLSNSAQSVASFFDGLEVGVSYFNRAQRMQYGFGVFRLANTYDVDYDVVRKERRFGGSLMGSYPLDKFNRIEGSIVLRYAQDHLLRSGMFQDAVLLSNYVSFVRDDTRFNYYGPASGQRFNVTAGFTRDLTMGMGDSFTLMTDARKYVNLMPDVVWATRVVAQGAFGNDQGNFYYGGPYSVRGYDRRTIWGSRGGFVQTEVRFPLLKGLRLGVPMPMVFPRMSIALLGDVGVAGDPGQHPQKIASTGVGFFMGGGYFPMLRLDLLRRTNLERWEPHNITRFTMGYNF